MTDVTQAPPPAAAPAPQQEVVIDQNPVQAPQPIGSQAPPRANVEVEGSKHRPESRREAIQRAFARARGEGEPGPAKPGIGHNNPPEPTEKIDLKKRPSPEQPSSARQPQERGDGGRFAARAPDVANGLRARTLHAPHQQQRQPAQQQRWPQLPSEARYREAPRRYADNAKAEWANTPESVRSEVWRQTNEFRKAYKYYKNDYETMNTIRHFERMAREQGTTLQRALGNYVAMEAKLRGDPVAGLDVIVNNLNLRTPQGHKITLRDIAHHILQQTPDQQKLLAAQNQQAALAQQLGQLNQSVTALAQHQQQLHYERRFLHTRGQVDRFAETHPRLDELGDIIERELRSGYDLETAYRRADLLRPSRAAQTRTHQAQTRKSDRSISGAPDGGSANGAHRSRPTGRRAAIADAIKRVNGAL